MSSGSFPSASYVQMAAALVFQININQCQRKNEQQPSGHFVYYRMHRYEFLLSYCSEVPVMFNYRDCFDIHMIYPHI